MAKKNKKSGFANSWGPKNKEGVVCKKSKKKKK
jgi:hypothetical protein